MLACCLCCRVVNIPELKADMNSLAREMERVRDCVLKTIILLSLSSFCSLCLALCVSMSLCVHLLAGGND